MVAWVVTYLDNNQDIWRKHHHKEKHSELAEIGTTKEEWDKKTREEKLLLIKTSHQKAEEEESPKSKRTRLAIIQKKANQTEHQMEQETQTQKYEPRIKQPPEEVDNRRPGDEDSMTRGVHEHTMHTALPTELTATKKKVDKEGLMVLEYGSHQNLQSKYT